MEEYLTVDELSARIKYSKQGLYNLIHKRILILGMHYLKPTPKNVLFKWCAIKEWLGESPSAEKVESVAERSDTATPPAKIVQVNSTRNQNNRISI